MKQTQQGFMGIVAVIIVALAIGGGVYYQQTVKQQARIDTTADVEIQKDVAKQEDQKITPTKKPIILSFEAKARAAAETSECSTWGTIGAATKLDERNQYALFAIDNSKIPSTRNTCVVDLYAGTIEAPIVITSESIAGPRKTESALIKQARSIAEVGSCKKEGIITSFEGTINRTDGGKTLVFRISSSQNQNEVGGCMVDVDLNTSSFSPIVR